MRPVPAGYEARVEVLVTEAMLVDFEELGRVHPLYATYSLAKHIEEASRKVILPFLEPGEEGVGSYVSVRHRAPALLGMRVTVVAEHAGTSGNRVTARCRAWNELGELVGEGETEQVVLSRSGLDRRLDEVAARWRAGVQPR